MAARDQQARKVDIVAPAGAVRARGGQLVVDDSAPVLGTEGVTLTAGSYVPTDVCDQGIADKLGIPGAYLGRLREHKPGLYDANVNGWLDGDDRRFLIRCLRCDSGGGAARAFLSDGYKIIDNLDVLLAALDGGRQSGMPRRPPGRTSAARSGHTRRPRRLVVQVCRNGMTITRDAMRAVHLGERLNEGVVSWSGSTRDKTLALITAKTTDAVAAFLYPGYVQDALRQIAKDAGHELADPQEAVKTVSQRLRSQRPSRPTFLVTLFGPETSRLAGSCTQ